MAPLPQGAVRRDHQHEYHTNRGQLSETRATVQPVGIDHGARDGLSALVPGGAFSTTGGLRHCVRATFATAAPDAIVTGIERFAEMVRREMARAGLDAAT